MVSRRKPRRGILLLIVLSLLVLFVLAAVTFIVVAGHYSSGSIARSQAERTGDKPNKLLDGAIYELLRDSKNRQSSLRHHSLLGDLYGNDGFVGRTLATLPRSAQDGAGLTRTADGQMTRLTFQLEYSLSQIDRLEGHYRPADYYNGAVITMVSGPARGLSARIIKSPEMPTAPMMMFAEAFVSDQNQIVFPGIQDRFVVNGIPFNGSGFGLNRSTGKLRPDLALSPHFKTFVGENGPYVDLGGADESYDAVDPQNMFLAKVPPNPQSSADITPSFHQPALIRYWAKKVNPGWNIGDPVPQNIIRPTILRPTQADHPYFTGSNNGVNGFDPLIGPWDVDNDGDGIMDSVWLDLGFPISTSSDGRLYRPLFAIMCTDLDGKLNLNVHGNLDQARQLLQGRNSIDGAGLLAGTAQTIQPPIRGLGYGPPEVNLAALFNMQDYARLLENRYASAMEQDNLRIAGTRPPNDLGNQNDPAYPAETLHMLKSSDAVLYARTGQGEYASPPDVSGSGVMALDLAGQPLFIDFPQAAVVNQTLEDPYKLNANQPNGWDSMYTVEQLERLLRVHDADATSLSQRLLNDVSLNFNTGEHRLVTTHSFNVPVPSVQLPPAMRAQGGGSPAKPSPTIVTWMQQRLLRGGVVAANIPLQLRLMLPFEMRHGGKLNINRRWSNSLNEFGREDGSGTKDSDLAMEAAMDMLSRQKPYLPDYDNDDELIENARRNNPQSQYAQTRQMFARHLYCITMLLLDPDYVDPTMSQTFDVSTEQGQRRAHELTARRIAQWAINVVDFRDPDAIMTPFEYDWNPMNGWQDTIDGNPATLDAPTSGGLNERRLIWGCEYPHLVLTETLAFHDTRLKDSKWDNDQDTGGKLRDEDGDGKSEVDPDDPENSDDDDLDQFRIPQGSFFAELYCTFDVNNRHPSGTVRVPPRELYTQDSDSRWKLDLERLPPENRTDGGVYPVWRLAISDFHVSDDSVYQRLDTHPDTTTLQPDRMDIFTDERVPIDRVVWFTPRRPTPSTYESDRIFWNRRPQARAMLAGKQYAVVGPRPDTMLGTAEPPTGVGNVASDRLISLNHLPGNRVNIPPDYPTDIQRPLGIVAAADWPTTWTNGDETYPDGIGINISEPLPTGTRYYREPMHRITTPQRFQFRDAYGIEGTSPEKLPDEPYDHREGRPLMEEGLLGEGTVEDVRTVFLQRLANPLRPWNPPAGTIDALGRTLPHDANLPVNPYITVDWLPIDLTVFNGDDQKPITWDDEENDEAWNFPQMFADQPGDFRFSTRERGDQETRLYPNVLEWTISDDLLPETSPEARPGSEKNYFQDKLIHTLGFLNSTYGPRRAPGGQPHYVGDPQRSFPWLTWNDRPYANHMELMLVPATSAPRLLLEFTTVTTDTPDDLYRGGLDNLRAPFEHLLNFFHSAKSRNPVGSVPPAGTPAPLQSDGSPQLYRLLELVEVPSRFVGTERWYNPTAFSQSGNASFDPASTFRPPFNRLSRFRDPGRININTIFDIRVWRAIAHGFPGKLRADFWRELVASRQGFVVDPTNPTQEQLDKLLQFPTEFGNPFRSSLGADLLFDLYKDQNSNEPDKMDVEATLLRPEPLGSDEPLFVHDSPNRYEHTGQNPYFRYQFLNRLSNIVSTQSNVYAVWITMGYFEIDPQTNTLSQELNADTGEVQRHRAFYIIDRSIPVAFEPGENHNVDRAVLLRRFIE